MQVIQLQVLIGFLVGIISAEIEFITVELPLKVKCLLVVLFSREKHIFFINEACNIFKSFFLIFLLTKNQHVAVLFRGIENL
jgi:hypothetical protein